MLAKQDAGNPCRMVASRHCGVLPTVFQTASHPARMRVSTPRREPAGSGWTACVRADVSSVTGKPLTQTYRLTINGNVIADRRRVEDEDNCASETYEPV